MIHYVTGGLRYGDTVEPLKMDTPRDKSKFPYYRGVRLIEVSQICHITVYMKL